MEYNVRAGGIAIEDVKKVVFGYTAGIGFDIDSQARVPVFLEAKYNGSFSSSFAILGNYWNQAFIVSVGVRM